MTDLREPIYVLRHPGQHRRLGALLAVVLALTISPAAASAERFQAAPLIASLQTALLPGPAADPGAPSIQYEEAQAHASDRNPFRPAAGDLGAAVVVGAGPLGRAQGIAPAARSLLQPAVSGLRREVFGFLPYWELGDPAATIDYATLSTIAYFSVPVDAGGNLVTANGDGSTATGWAGWTSPQLTNVINAAHQQGVRVVLCLTLFGWTTSEAAAQGAMLGSATARMNLAQQAVQAVVDRGADGINLDFEPIGAGHGADFTMLVRAIRAELDARLPGSQLTFDATAEVGNYPVADATAPGGADAVLVMGYDYRTAGSPIAGAVAPLNGPAYDIGDTLAAYLGLTTPGKVILGVPYYGRAWSTVSNAPNAQTQSGTKFGSSATATYATAFDFAALHGRNYDVIEESAWTAYTRENCTATYGCVTSWRELYYDDAQSLAAKYDLVNRLGLRGAGIWALGYDGTHPELARVLIDKFVNDTSSPRAGIVALPPTQVSETFLVTWTAVDDTSSVVGTDVDVSVDGGPWTPWLTAATSSSAQYAGASGHTYAFRVRATDGLGHAGEFAPADTGIAPPVLGPGGFARVAVDGLTVRAGPDPGAQRVTSLNTGALVAITAGPVNAGGFTWFEVTEPIREWPPVTPVLAGVWVAAGSAAAPYLLPARAPNSTVVGAAGPDTTPPSLTVKLLGPLFVSPNGDGRLDTVEVRGTATGGASWALQITPAADLTGAPLRVIGGIGETIAAGWDGRAEGGVLLPDGLYRLRLVSADAVGNQAAQEWIVQLDTVAPGLLAKVSPGGFSPNDDGYAETARLSVTPSEAVTGTIEILHGTAMVRRVALVAAGPTIFAWDGRDSGGRGAADGIYAAQVTAQDAAGNITMRRLSIALDRTGRLLRWSPGRFAPKSGRAATVSYNLSRTATVTLLVRSPNGKSVRTAWSNRVQRAGRITWTWDGRNGTGHAVSPGNYVAVLVIRTAIGNTTIMRTVVVK